MSDYRIWVNDERTVLFRTWGDGTDGGEIATRETPADTWGPPIRLTEEPSEARRTLLESARLLQDKEDR